MSNQFLCPSKDLRRVPNGFHDILRLPKLSRVFFKLQDCYKLNNQTALFLTKMIPLHPVLAPCAMCCSALSDTNTSQEYQIAVTPAGSSSAVLMVVTNQTQPKQTKNHLFCLFVQAVISNQSKPNQTFTTINLKLTAFNQIKSKVLEKLARAAQLLYRPVLVLFLPG